MFLKILKKDIKRKKAMNIILFLFMIMASMLIASSVNLLYTTTTALENFKKLSHTSDNMILTFSNPENDKRLEDWSSKCSLIKSINSEEMILVSADNLTVSSQYKKLEDGATLAVTRIPQKNDLVFDHEDNPLKLKHGEIALPNTIRDNTGIKIGDFIKIKIADKENEFIVKSFIKDVAFGSGLMGFKRIIISDAEFADFYAVKEKSVMKLWSITKQDNASYEDIEKDFSKNSIASISTFNSNIISYTYIMDLMVAAIMSIVSIFLILISFLILRFTIRFTIEEDYKEIGIMKAIGLKNRGIKNIYMVKYLALSIFGGAVGYALSIPFSAYLLDNISRNIMLKTTILNYFLAALSVILIISITTLFCNFCTRRINKMSAIEAIRQGSTGERFTVSRKLKLHKMKRMSSPLFMAVSDLVSSFRKFVILTITFILGTVIIIVPINMINTLASDDIITLFGLGNTDLNIKPESYGLSYLKVSIEKFLDDIEDIETRMKEKGFNVDIHPEIMLMTKIYADDPNDSKTILSFQGYDYSTDKYIYLEGTAPKLENEIAVTEKLAEYLGIGLGDTVNCINKNSTDRFIVTALFQSMNNLGFSARFSEEHKINIEDGSGFQMFGEIKDKVPDKKETIKRIKSEFPELSIKSSNEYVESLMGNITNQFGIIKNIILTVVLGINFLITCLLVRMLITKEIPEIAILKSLGFKSRDIRKWQAARIMIVLIISIIMGTLIANLTGNFLASGIFGFMGATLINLTIEPIQVYLIYPLIILAVTMSSVIISLGQVKRTNIWEINNQE